MKKKMAADFRKDGGLMDDPFGLGGSSAYGWDDHDERTEHMGDKFRLTEKSAVVYE